MTTQLHSLIQAAESGSRELCETLLRSHPDLVHQRDTNGATALHYAAFAGKSEVVRLLVQFGADINARDSRFNATPAGWAIEYLREMNGYLGIELDDLAFALRVGDAKWVARFLRRFPGLREAADNDGTPFRKLAGLSGNEEIINLFEEQQPH